MPEANSSTASPSTGTAAGCCSSHEVIGCGARGAIPASSSAVAIPTSASAAASAILAIHLGLVFGEVVLGEQMLVVCRVHVRDVQEPVAADAEVDKRGLDHGSMLTIRPL